MEADNGDAVAGARLTAIQNTSVTLRSHWPYNRGMIELPTEAEPVRIVEGDCLEVMPTLPADAFDSIVSDPPYGLGFKPLALMEWLVKLVTPKDGLVLDPFGGSGTTGKAAANVERRAVLIEREAAYADIARRRVAEAMGTGLLAGIV